MPVTSVNIYPPVRAYLEETTGDPDSVDFRRPLTHIINKAIAEYAERQGFTVDLRPPKLGQAGESGRGRPRIYGTPDPEPEPPEPPLDGNYVYDTEAKRWVDKESGVPAPTADDVTTGHTG